MRMKKFFCMVLAWAAVIGCLSVSVEAVETAEQEMIVGITRSTRQFSIDIPGDTLLTDEMDFSMEIGETITISATYTPRSANVDFGFIAPDGLFYSVSGENGKIDVTIKVSQRGNYTLAVENNSSNAVSVLGYVNF